MRSIHTCFFIPLIFRHGNKSRSQLSSDSFVLGLFDWPLLAIARLSVVAIAIFIMFGNNLNITYGTVHIALLLSECKYMLLTDAPSKLIQNLDFNQIQNLISLKSNFLGSGIVVSVSQAVLQITQPTNKMKFTVCQVTNLTKNVYDDHIKS